MPTRVLIADGDTQRLHLAVTTLEAAGFIVAATPDGGDAFARFFEEQPDLVICTGLLPSLSGYNFARMVRSQSPQTRVIVLDDGSPLEAVDGALFLPLPVTAEALRRAVPELVPAELVGSAAPASLRPTHPSDFARDVLHKYQSDSNLLALLDGKGIDAVAAIAVEKRVDSDAPVIAQGDPGDGCYLVVEGRLRVVISEGGEREVARIGAGEFFGEMALLNNAPRSATVWALSDCVLLFFPKEAFLPILEQYPTMREVLSGVALQRTEQNLWQVLIDDQDVVDSIGTIETRQSLARSAVSGMMRVTARLGDMRAKLAAYDKERRQRLLRDPRVLAAAAGGLALLVAIVSLVASGGDDTPAAEPALTAAETAAEPSEPKSGSSMEPRRATGGPAPEDGPDRAAESARLPAASVAAGAREARSASEVADRKASRKALMAAYGAKKLSDAVAVGRKLRKKWLLDWEAYWAIAEAERRLGEAEPAVQSYRHFFETFAGTVFADDARFRAGELLVELGREDEARPLFETVAADPASNYAEQAAALLRRSRSSE